MCAVAFLVGCGGEKDLKASTAVPGGIPKYLHKNAVYFPDGEGLEFSGTLRRYDLVSNEKGEFDRYTFEFAEDIMAVEGAVFAVLAKRGYHRKVRRDSEGLFVVNYLRKGFSPVSMNYERVPKKDGVEAFTRVRVVWKNA